MMKTLRVFFVLASLLVAFLWTGDAVAYDEPAVNLGFTSFVDGGPPSGPGWYYQQYIQYYTTDTFKDSSGGSMMIPTRTEGVTASPELDVWVSLSQLIYQSDDPIIAGGKWGIDLIIPYVSMDLEPEDLVLSDNGSGFGDVLVGPFLQWDPVMGENGPVFMHRVELQMIFPTGKYDNDSALNPGANHFSLNPYWAGTWFIQPRWTATARVHYLWNAENDEPMGGPEGTPEDTQAGDAVHANFASAWEFVPGKLRVGINGYYLDQVSESESDGVEVPDSKETVFAYGPGALVHLSKDSHLFVNAYFETDVENRPEGERFNIRYVHHF